MSGTRPSRQDGLAELIEELVSLLSDASVETLRELPDPNIVRHSLVEA
jgi:hypothetical protein